MWSFFAASLSAVRRPPPPPTHTSIHPCAGKSSVARVFEQHGGDGWVVIVPSDGGGQDGAAGGSHGGEGRQSDAKKGALVCAGVCVGGLYLSLSLCVCVCVCSNGGLPDGSKDARRY